MNNKILFALLGVILVGAGLIAAVSITGANVDPGVQTRWGGDTAGSITTEGGNITMANISGTTLTDRWAAFWGNVSGSIKLTDGTNDVYVWTWTPTAGGVVCLSEKTTSPFSNMAVTTAGAVDAAYVLGSVTDNAVGTVNGNCSLTMNDGPITSTDAILDATTNWNTCLVGNTVDVLPHDFAFCQAIADGNAYNGQPANYEVMVPTTPGEANTETYYFYMELH